jgi:hypothetical protein
MDFSSQLKGNSSFHVSASKRHRTRDTVDAVSDPLRPVKANQRLLKELRGDIGKGRKDNTVYYFFNELNHRIFIAFRCENLAIVYDFSLDWGGGTYSFIFCLDYSSPHERRRTTFLFLALGVVAKSE